MENHQSLTCTYLFLFRRLRPFVLWTAPTPPDTPSLGGSRSYTCICVRVPLLVLVQERPFGYSVVVLCRSVTRSGSGRVGPDQALPADTQ